MANIFRKENTTGATADASVKKGKWSIGLAASTGTDFFKGVGTPYPANEAGLTIYQMRTTNGKQYANIRVCPIDVSDTSNGFSTSTKIAQYFNHMGYQGSTTATTAAMWEALNWAATQDEILVTNGDFPAVVTEGLGLAIDSYYLPSCSGPAASTVYDLSGNLRHFSGGSVSNGQWGSTANPKGRTVLLSGSSADTPTSSLLNNDRHSIYVVLRFKSSASYPNGYTGGWEQFMGYYSAGSDRSPGIWRFPSQRWIHWTYDPGNTSTNFGKDGINGTEFDLNRDFAICMIKDNGTTYVYVNGELVGTGSAVATKVAGDSVFRLYWYYTSGLMDISKVLVYSNKVLSDEEVKLNYYGKIITSGLAHRLDSTNLVCSNAPYVIQSASADKKIYDLKSSLAWTMENGAGYLLPFGYGVSSGVFFNFDGADDRWTIPAGNSITPGNGAWTVSAWVRPVAGGGGIMGNTSGGPVTSSFGIFSNTIAYFHYDGSWQYRYGYTTLTMGTWVHLTWVNYSNSTMLMYVNGKPDSAVFNSYTTNGGPIDCIGNPWPYTAFNGQMQSIQINAGVSFTTEQVLWQYENSRDIFDIAIAQRG